MYMCLSNFLSEWLRDCTKHEGVFIEHGFSYWNDGLRRLKKHEASKTHQQTIAMLKTYSQQTPIHEQLSHAIKVSRDQNNATLCYVINALKFLSRQHLAIRGRQAVPCEGDENFNLEPDSNLNQVNFLLGHPVFFAFFSLQESHSSIC